jgi:hypothetical protein
MRSATTIAARIETRRRGIVTGKLCAFVAISFSLLSLEPTLCLPKPPVGVREHRSEVTFDTADRMET